MKQSFSSFSRELDRENSAPYNVFDMLACAEVFSYEMTETFPSQGYEKICRVVQSRVPVCYMRHDSRGRDVFFFLRLQQS